MERNKNFYHLLLAYALVEIRALEDNAAQASRELADMFHHIPEALNLEWTVERESRVHKQLVAKAKVYGRSELVDRWEQRAARRLAGDNKARQEIE